MKIRRSVIATSMVGVVFLVGCVGILLLSVVQPTEGKVGQSFVTSVTAQIYDSGDEGALDEAEPVFAVNLPECFEVLSCSADINGDSYSCEEPPPLEQWILDIIGQLFGTNWVAQGISGFPEGENSVVFNWTILPNCPGNFNLDYLVWLSGPSSDVTVTVDSSGDHPIQISAMRAIAVPTMSGYHIMILAGLLLIYSVVHLRLKKRRAGNLLRSIVPFLFLAAVSIQIVGGISTANAVDVKMDLTVENVKTFVQNQNSNAAKTSEETVSTETVRDVILANFNLTTEQAAFLAQLSDEDLEELYEKIVNAENVDDVRCMFVNGNSPMAVCTTLK